jgi:hypothetical protein
MASAMKPTNGTIPTGYVSPFKRVPMNGTHDDLLACAATLCNKSMEDVKKMAVTLGLRANGPFTMDETLFRKIMFNLSPYAVSDYKDFKSVAALPALSVLCFDYAEDETCRHVVFHRVSSTADVPAFVYVIDVANWLDPKQQITSDFSHLRIDVDVT